MAAITSSSAARPPHALPAQYNRPEIQLSKPRLSIIQSVELMGIFALCVFYTAAS